MMNRMTRFIEKYNILSPNQFGFQQGKSTTNAIVTFTEYIYNSLNKGNHDISLFIDLKKAFDTINHNILLQKLHHYGFRGIALQWLKSYLENRIQCVKIGNSLSNQTEINIGVPQGSILGPLLFLLYINDLPNASNLFSTILFADDTTISMRSENFCDLVETFNIELINIKKWLIKNRLSINLEKTYYMVFSNRLPPSDVFPLYFDHSQIKMEANGKFLGVFIDNRLSFKDHISYIHSKISKTIGIFYKVKHYLPENILINLYYSLVYPYLLYCNLAWGGCAPSHSNRLLLLQKRIVRHITNQAYLAHTNLLFIRTGILKVSDIHFYLLAIEAYKINNTGAFNLPSHTYQTRNRYTPIPTMQRLNAANKSLHYSVPYTWNLLPEHVKQCHNLKTFKKQCKDFLLSRYIN